MKKKALSLFLMLTIFHLSAATLRVCNRSGIHAPYTTIAAALTAAAASGDIILVEAGTYSESVTVTKQVRIIGTGNFLSSNSQTQALTSISSRMVGDILFSTGSGGSIMEGMNIQGSVILSVSNITIKRNLLESQFTRSAVLIGYNATVSNIDIQQNYCYNTFSSTAAISIYSNSSGNIKNNYIGSNTSSGGIAIYIASTSGSWLLLNNVIMDDINNSSATVNFINNIMVSGSISGTSNHSYSNNIGNGTQFPATNGNQQNVNMTNVLVSTGLGATDNGYQLKVSSPAIGAGLGGGDCGMFSNDSGGESYVLSGMPIAPAIYQITIPSAGSTSLNINIKAASH